MLLRLFAGLQTLEQIPLRILKKKNQSPFLRKTQEHKNLHTLSEDSWYFLKLIHGSWIRNPDFEDQASEPQCLFLY